jgi:hypothetical protein
VVVDRVARSCCVGDELRLAGQDVVVG